MAASDKPKLSHVDDQGQAHMVDVTTKRVTERTATASAQVTGQPDVMDALLAGNLPKGEAVSVARIAGISAAKRTADLIPLCHPLSLDWVDVVIRRQNPDSILIEATAKTASRTGVEMEAMTAASVAALTLYDMAKAADKSIEIGPIRLESKSGGKSGDYRRGQE